MKIITLEMGIGTMRWFLNTCGIMVNYAYDSNYKIGSDNDLNMLLKVIRVRKRQIDLSSIVLFTIRTRPRFQGGRASSGGLQ